jgi:two-component system, response regulator
MVNANEIEILLVEDNPYDMELTLRALKGSLINNIHVARDGEEALEYLLPEGADKENEPKNLPRVILLDLKLPKVDGLEVLRRIRESEKTKLIPVVVLTSSLEEKDVVESYRLGVNSYIVKPVEFDQFIKSVSELGLYWLLLNKPPF